MKEKKQEMNDIEIQKRFFHPICNENEINRIFNVQTADDYLLKLRAETVVDNMRLFRVIRNRYLKNEKEWNFTNHFSQIEIDNYIGMLSTELQKKTNLTKGFLFSNDPNGSLIRTEYGDIINISEALRYFLFYMNLCYLEFGVDIPYSIRHAGRMIAIRTMLKTETLDFEQDPRGIIPNQIEKINNEFVRGQLEFIVGHELAHHFCNHLDSSNLIERSLYRPLKGEEEGTVEKFYNHSQKQEFEADIFAIKALITSKELKDKYIYQSILFFAYLDIFQAVSDYIFPPNSSYKTHPEPIERLWNIYSTFESEILSFKKEDIESMLKIMEEDKKWLIEDVGFNIETYEMYGSVYLAEPNSEWRGKELKDRIDYY